MNKFARVVRQSRNVLVALPATIGGYAMAAVPEAVNTELTALKADALTVAGLILAAIVAIYAFKFIRKGL